MIWRDNDGRHEVDSGCVHNPPYYTARGHRRQHGGDTRPVKRISGPRPKEVAAGLANSAGVARGVIFFSLLLCVLMFAGCQGTATDPFGPLAKDVIFTDAATVTTTELVQVGVLPPAQGLEAWKGFLLARIALRATVPIAAASGTPTPTEALPNPITLEQLNVLFAQLDTDMAALHAVSTMTASVEIAGARAKARAAPPK